MKTLPLIKLAEWIHGCDIAGHPPTRFDRLKRHLVDTLGARIAGSTLEEGVAASRLADSIRDSLYASVIASCAHVRCTESDDIHLASCTTPGSVIVPTVLALAEAGVVRSVGEACSAALAGYESMIRLGMAIDGPSALRRGIWPTHFAAAFGSAAATSRALKISVDKTAGALATAMAFGSGPPASGVPASSSRWITLGIAAANGMLAARSAEAGLVGTMPAVLSSKALADGLGRRCLFDDVGLKPFPTARQGLAAIEAARSIVDGGRLSFSEIESIDVHLPEAQRAIVDRVGMPSTRFESIVSLRYQLALAITAGDHLADVVRKPIFDSPELRLLMARTRVRRGRDLDARYPRAWPARVTVRARGRLHARLVLHPYGDARKPLDWDAIERKFVLMTTRTLGDRAARKAVHDIRDSGAESALPELGDLA